MPHRLSTAPTLDSLSNLAASLNAGKDKAAHDAFFVPAMARDQVEAMYRGDWLARKIVDIVPYDCVREWREWHGDPADVVRVEQTERRLGLTRAVQRAMVLGRLYGGGALIIGTRDSDPAALARELRPEAVGPDGITFLHAVSRWQLGVAETDRDPLSPWFGEPTAYEVVAPERGTLTLHPSRVIRFLGNPLPDPALFGAEAWSDSVLSTLYDAIHAVALTTTGATSLMHEAKVDVVTVPNLSEHLSNAATTAQLSARFAYAATMKSLNNLLLLGDGESWTRQKIDFAGLPEMVRTFLQVAAGAADIPVTRLLGQSPAGLSATGDSDTRNYYDMIAARQEIELRPQLDRLDRLLLASSGLAPAALRFEFRPLWQMDAAAKAAVALQKAQATQIYAGLGLWPAEVMAGLVRGQLAEDGTYPGGEGVFSSEAHPDAVMTNSAVVDSTADALPDCRVADWPGQPRDPLGQFSEGKVGGELSIIQVAHFWEHEKKRRERRAKRERRRREKREGEENHVSEEKADRHTRAEQTERPKPATGAESKAQTGSAGDVFSHPSIVAPPPPSTFVPEIPPEVGPGRYARAAVRAGPTKKISAEEQRLINAIGDRDGCSSCPRTEPGTTSGNWIGDHQPSRALGIPILLYTHCARCSARQGAWVRALKKGGFGRASD